MKILRGILAGIAFGIIAEIFGWIIYGVLFMRWSEQVSQLWRPMESLYWRMGMPLTDILNGLLIALGYAFYIEAFLEQGLKRG